MPSFLLSLKMYNEIISMISYLFGKISSKKDKFITLMVGNIGFKVFMSKKALLSLGVGKEIGVFCFLNVKENILDLYGFLTQDELDFFEVVETIRGIGPKAALEISSIGSLEKIKDRILKNDETLFSGIPGIGRKKAMTIIVELSGKIRAFPTKTQDGEAESALVGLGFSKQQARDVLKQVPNNLTPEERIKQALKIVN